MFMYMKNAHMGLKYVHVMFKNKYFLTYIEIN
jgi:hypothetical protein